MSSKLLLPVVLFLASVSSGFGQLKGLDVELVDNNGLVPGRTYRIYAVMSSEGDLIDAIFGEADSPLILQAKDGFFQHPAGGPLSKDVLRYQLENDDALAYDSWLTIGAEDNYQNSVAAFPPTFESALASFESGGDLETNDGAWFVTPDQRQCKAGADMRILLMQITTRGKVYGSFGVHGRTKSDDDGGFEVIQVNDVNFVIKRSFWSKLFNNDNLTYLTSIAY